MTIESVNLKEDNVENKVHYIDMVDRVSFDWKSTLKVAKKAAIRLARRTGTVRDRLTIGKRYSAATEGLQLVLRPRNVKSCYGKTKKSSLGIFHHTNCSRAQTVETVRSPR